MASTASDLRARWRLRAQHTNDRVRATYPIRTKSTTTGIEPLFLRPPLLQVARFTRAASPRQQMPGGRRPAGRQVATGWCRHGR